MQLPELHSNFTAASLQHFTSLQCFTAAGTTLQLHNHCTAIVLVATLRTAQQHTAAQHFTSLQHNQAPLPALRLYNHCSASHNTTVPQYHSARKGPRLNLNCLFFNFEKNIIYHPSVFPFLPVPHWKTPQYPTTYIAPHQAHWTKPQ